MNTTESFSPNTPTQFVILGGAGDLSTRKLLPALLDLFSKNMLPDSFEIIGVGRTKRSDEDYQRLIVDSLQKNDHHIHTEKSINDFCKHLRYISGSFEDFTLYTSLIQSVTTFNTRIQQCSNTLIYLAVPPEHYEVIFKNVHAAKLSEPCSETTGWTRILVEKPFGQDYKSAEKLDALLGSLFKEEQIFRIDHYVAKEAIQNILSFRFANTLTQQAWTKETISHIRIKMFETLDVSNRGSFYDGIGALRDVGQNHLLQLLALVTMDEPEEFTAHAIRNKRAEILESLSPYSADTIKDAYQRAQYKDYTTTAGVQVDSQTETAFSFTTCLQRPDWHDIPITVTSAKAAKEACVTVTIQFNDVATGLFQTESCKTIGNEITLVISPEQAMYITLNAKAPGHGYQIESRTLSFACSEHIDEIKNSYERVLMDCIIGDQTLFVSSREVMAQWKFITSILDHQDLIPLQTYTPGSDPLFRF